MGQCAVTFVNPSWMPHSVSEAARAGDATAEDLVSGRAWSHLLDALHKAADVVAADDVARNPVDLAAGFRHLLVLLVLGADQALRAGGGARPGRQAFRSRRRLQVGHGLSGLHLHGSTLARR